MKVIAGTRAVH